MISDWEPLLRAYSNIQSIERKPKRVLSPLDFLVWQCLPLCIKEGSGLLCFTELPKTGATNQNAPSAINEYLLCLLHQRNYSNCNTIVLRVSGLRVKRRLMAFWEGPFTLVGTWEIQNTAWFSSYRETCWYSLKVDFCKSEVAVSKSNVFFTVWARHFRYNHFCYVISPKLNSSRKTLYYRADQILLFRAKGWALPYYLDLWKMLSYTYFVSLTCPFALPNSDF